jgi:hypothetical protein
MVIEMDALQESVRALIESVREIQKDLKTVTYVVMGICASLHIDLNQFVEPAHPQPPPPAPEPWEPPFDPALLEDPGWT